MEITNLFEELMKIEDRRIGIQLSSYGKKESSPKILIHGNKTKNTTKKIMKLVEEYNAEFTLTAYGTIEIEIKEKHGN